MKFVADLHLHSRYSRAVSQAMVLPNMAKWAKLKGINVLATGDFTHPFWFEKLKNELEDAGNGLFRLKPEISNSDRDVQFLLSCEISSIYTQGGKGRRIHNLFFFPSLASVFEFNKQLVSHGANLRSDGRPIVGLSSRDLVKMALAIDDRALIIPAHIWTPWFAVFGSFSGFDSIEECFGDMAKYIYGIETGLSSDPAMNWKIADLDDRAILSFSDAHSLEKMGREATVFEAEEISYDSIYNAICKSNKTGPATPSKISFTIEFYPEEGKYHFTGHRDCNFSQSPEESKKNGDICPVCKRPLTVGVMHRVQDLESREIKVKSQVNNGVRWISGQDTGRPPYVCLVPLGEIIAEALGVGVGSKKVVDQYMALVQTLGSEFGVLLKSDLLDIAKLAPGKVVQAIELVRSGNIVVEPGYDGKFGTVKIWKEDEQIEKSAEGETQLNLLA